MSPTQILETLESIVLSCSFQFLTIIQVIIGIYGYSDGSSTCSRTFTVEVPVHFHTYLVLFISSKVGYHLVLETLEL